jgi:hypothetical protein
VLCFTREEGVARIGVYGGAWENAFDLIGVLSGLHSSSVAPPVSCSVSVLSVGGIVAV